MSGSGNGSNPLILQLGAEFSSGTAAALQAATTATQNWGNAADIAAKQDSNMADAIVANATKVTSAQRNRIAAADDLTKAQSAAAQADSLVAAAAAALATAQQTGSASVASLQRSYDNLVASQTKAQTTLAAVQEKYGTYPAAATAVVQATNQVSTAINNTTSSVVNAQKAAVEHTASLGQQQFASRQLTVQFSQMFSGILSGQPVLQTFIQQGHQIIDVAASTGTSLTSALGGALKTVGGYLTGAGGVIGGFAAIAAAVAYFGVESLEAGQKQAALGTLLRATRSDYDSAAASAIAAGRAFASSSGVGGSVASQTANIFAATPDFNATAGNYATLTQTAKDLAAVMGETVPQAAKTLSAALMDPAAVAEQLYKSDFPGFTAALVDNIKQEQANGEYNKAFSDTLGLIQLGAGKAGESMGPLGKAMAGVSDAFKDATGQGKGFWDLVGEGMGKDVLFTLNQLQGLLQAIAAARKIITTPAPAGLPANTVTATAAGLGFGSTVGRSPTGSVDSNGYIDPLLQQIAGQLGASMSLGTSTFQSYLSALQSTEGQFKNGAWQTSSSGAVGPLQVLPSLFYGNGTAGSGIVNQLSQYPATRAAIADNGGNADLSNSTISSTAGSEYFSHLLTKYNNDVWDATIAYHYGEPVADAFLKNQSDTSALVKIDQGAGITQANTVTSLLGLSAGARRGTGDGSDYISPGQLLVNQGQATGDQVGSLLAQQQANTAAQKQVNDALSAAPVGSDQYEKLEQALTTLQGQATKLKTVWDQYTESQKNALDPMTKASGAARDIATQVQAEDASVYAATGKHLSLAQAATVSADAQAKLNIQFSDSVKTINDQTAANEALVNVQGLSVAAIQHIKDVSQATQEVQKTSVAGSATQTQQITILAAAYDKLHQSQVDQANAAQLPAQQQQLDYLQKQISLLGESTDAQTKDLAIYQERQKIEASGGDPNSGISQQLEANAGSIAAAGQNLNDLKNDITSFTNIGTTAFSSVGQAITNAFVNGTSAGVSFGTTMKGILAQLLIQLGELLILDPIMNSLTGSNSNATLSGYLSAITGTGSSSGNSTLMNAIGVAGSAIGLGGQGSGVTTSGAGGTTTTTTTGGASSLGTNAGVISNLQSLYSIGKGIYSGLSGGTFSTGFPIIDSVLNFNTGIGGAAGVSASDAGAAAADGVGGTAGTVAGAGGASVGSLLGGAGAGFALGTLLNDYIFKGNQTNGTIGAGVGAVAGSVAGAAIAGIPTLGIAAPIGALIGGLIGGALGGTGGGMIGPALPNYGYEVTEGATSNGLLGILKSGGEGDPGGAAAQALAKQVSAYNDSFNQILAQAGISVSGSTILGGNNYSKNGKGDAASGNAGKETTDLNSIFANLSFSSSNSVLNSALTNPLTKPQNITQLSAISDAFADLSKNLATLLNPLNGTNDAIGTYGTQLATLNANYATGIQEAKTLGLSTKSLTDAQAEAQQQLQASAQATVNASLAGFAVRDLTATGQTNQAALLQQQVSAQEETAAFSASLVSLYGTNFKNTSEYASDMALLTKTQQDESNALQAQQAAAAAAAQAQAAAAAAQNYDAAQQTITSIYASYTAFLKTLQTSTQSPMSPQAALAAARSTFAQDAAAAAAGDSTAFGNLQGDATNLLSASRTVNGSGAGYVSDYNAVVNAGGVASGDAGLALTNDAMAKIAQTQTDQFVAAIQGLQQTMQQIRTELQLGNAAA